MTQGEMTSGNDMVDSLRGLQIVANRIVDPDGRIDHVRNGLSVIGARELALGTFLVSAGSVFAHRVDLPDDRRVHFSDGVVFKGMLRTMTYLQDPDIPVDSLALRFILPNVIHAGGETEAYQDMDFQVPVLEIEHCSQISAAA